MVEQQFKQTEIGLIPDDWELLLFSDLFTFLSTASYSRSELDENSYTGYIHYGDIHTRIGYHLDTNEFVSGRITDDKLKTYPYLKQGDLVIADASEDYTGVGKGFEVINNPEVPVISGLHTFLAREKGKKFALGFKGYFHSNPLIKKQYDALATGLKVYSLSKSVFNKIHIPIPPLPEQQAIAEALTHTDEWVESLENLIAKKRLIKQGAMQQLLIPKSDWDSRRLGEMADIYTGSKNNQDKIENGNYPFFVRSQKVERIDSYSFDGEAILVPGEGNLGSIFHYVNEKFDFHQRVYKISNFNGVCGRFLFWYFQMYFGSHAMKNTVKATVDSIRLPTLQEFVIHYPLYEQQISIATILSDIDSEIAALEQKLNKVQQIKQGMMQELLTGRIRLIEAHNKEQQAKPRKSTAKP